MSLRAPKPPRTAPTRAERQAHPDRPDRRGRAAVHGHGFHATSLDAVADAAGYTKGAVYSNFASKEDLFFAVYERRVERSPEHAAHCSTRPPTSARAARAWSPRQRARARARADGWLAVFLEFWTHVLRHPEHRARFAAAPRARASSRSAARSSASPREQGIELPIDVRAARRSRCSRWRPGSGSSA